MFERQKIQAGWLRSVRVFVGNKGWVNTLEGKTKMWGCKVDWAASTRFRHQRGNFEDWSCGLNLKFNL